MTKFEYLTKDVDTLASAIYSIIDETETHILEYIANNTGIEVTRIAIAPEIRVAKIAHDLLEEHDGDT